MGVTGFNLHRRFVAASRLNQTSKPAAVSVDDEKHDDKKQLALDVDAMAGATKEDVGKDSLEAVDAADKAKKPRGRKKSSADDGIS